MDQITNRKIHSRKLVKALTDEGFLIPDACYNVDIAMSPNGAVIVKYEVALTVGQLAALARACARVANDLVPDGTHCPAGHEGPQGVDGEPRL